MITPDLEEQRAEKAFRCVLHYNQDVEQGMKDLCADWLLTAKETGYEVPFTTHTEAAELREQVRVLREALDLIYQMSIDDNEEHHFAEAFEIPFEVARDVLAATEDKA